jgi:ketosteroid isomerase-like protein
VSANLDLVRSIFNGWGRGDYSSSEWAHPEIEFVSADGPSPGSWRGLAGMRESVRDFQDTWEGFRSEGDEYRELDDERVLVLIRRAGRGKASGLELAQMKTGGVNLFHVRDGKVARIVRYFDRGEAFADLGLKE